MSDTESKQRVIYLEEVEATERTNIGRTEIDLVDYFYYALQKLKYLILAVVIGGGIIFVYSFFLATPLYEATSQLYVVSSKDSVINLSDMQIGSYLANDYQLVFKTWEVNEQVIKNLKLPYSIEEIKKMLVIKNPASTRALFITFTSPDPQLSADVANEYAAVASDYISRTMDTDVPRVLSSAVAPSIPVSPNKLLNMIIGLTSSFFLGISALFVSYLRNDKIVTDADILKYTGVSTLVVIPTFDAQVKKRSSIFQGIKTRKPRGKRV